MHIFKKIGRVTLILLLTVLAVLLLAIGGLNIAKYIIYRDYYKMESNVCDNPGLGDGFVCQGIAVAEEKNVILVSGYMKDKSASRIYVTNEDDEDYYVTLKQGDSAFTGHVGGIATTGSTVYLANDGRIHLLSLSDLLDANEGDALDVGEGIRVNNQASFVYTDDSFLFVGEFHDGGKYTVEGHENETAEGTHYAICTQYALGDLTTPLAVYTLRNKVQGICFTPGGKVILSTSYGVADTVYYVYDLKDATRAEKDFEGAPLYYLDHLEREVKGPAMGEDLDWSDGHVITLTESASDKYIFGKLFGATKIVALKF